MAAGGIAVAATLALGVAGAAAAPNPGPGTGGSTVIDDTLVSPLDNTVYNTSPQYPSDIFPDGPQTANIPTLAWVGEEVRLVACDKVIQPSPITEHRGQDGEDHSPVLRFQTGAWSLENWTGDQAYNTTPTFDGQYSTNIYVTNTGGTSFFWPSGISGDHPDKGCVSANIKSLRAGLSIVKLDVNEQNVKLDSDDTPDLDPTVVYSQQFTVIWMVPSSPVITEASVQTQGSSINALAYPGTPGTDAPPTTFSQLTSGPNGGLANATSFLGDPTGNGLFSPDLWGNQGGTGGSNEAANETPSTNNGLIDVRVKGTFPIEDSPYYGESGPGTNVAFFGQTSFTMPDDWAKLAGIWATSNIDNTGTNPALWDIHGGPTNPITHITVNSNQLATVCGGAANLALFTNATADSVDSCANNGSNVGNPFVFSRVFGDVTNGPGGTVGPFDPQAPNETLLSDGRLNSDDAPMPALPVTVSIKPNSGNPGDLSGVGGLYGVSKYLIYSHDFNGSAASPTSLGTLKPLTTTGTGNLYNPFYSEFIPSTTRPINEASGITGVYNEHHYVVDGSSGNDFPGFSNGDTDAYTYWTALEASGPANGGANTHCLRRIDGGTGGDTGPIYYQTPNYPNSVLVYTDERGEAYVVYNPGDGFYFDNLTGTTDLTNNACDLQNVGTLGTSAISAQANFPYQAVEYRTPAPSNTITKTVTSKFNKTLSAYPKLNPGSGTFAAYDSIFVANATDINGAPFVHEVVCFTVQTVPSGAFTGGLNVFPQEPAQSGLVYNAAGAVVADVSQSPAVTPTAPLPSGYSENSVCAYTNKYGNAAVEVSGSVNPVDVTAHFVDENGLTRDLTTSLGSGFSSTGTPPTVISSGGAATPAGSAGSNGTSGGSNSGASSGGGSTGGSTSVTSGSPLAAVANVCKVKSIRLHSKRGKYSASFKVSCSHASSDSVTIRAYRRNGKLLRTYRTTVSAGGTVTVGVGKKVGHVTVTA